MDNQRINTGTTFSATDAFSKFLQMRRSLAWTAMIEPTMMNTRARIGPADIYVECEVNDVKEED